MINGFKLYGNIGNIYINEKNPVKIRDCHFGASCNNDDCKYFHNPLLYDNSKDVRNYIANSWLYWSNSTDNKHRRFGSHDMIDTDMVVMKQEEKSLFGEQVMHEILCMMLLAKYVRA